MRRVYYYYDELPDYCKKLADRVNAELKRMNLQNDTKVSVRIVNSCREPRKCRMAEIPSGMVAMRSAEDVDHAAETLNKVCGKDFVKQLAGQIYDDSGRRAEAEMQIFTAGTDKCPAGGENGLLLFWRIFK